MRKEGEINQTPLTTVATERETNGQEEDMGGDGGYSSVGMHAAQRGVGKFGKLPTQVVR